jgi:hypothetical protein
MPRTFDRASGSGCDEKVGKRDIEIGTVDVHIRSVRQKLDLLGQAELTRMVRSMGDALHENVA